MTLHEKEKDISLYKGSSKYTEGAIITSFTHHFKLYTRINS